MESGIKYLFLILILILSLPSFATQDNQVDGKVIRMQGAESGLYFSLSGGLPKSCKNAPSNYLFIGNENVAAMIIVSTEVKGKLTVFAKFDPSSQNCKVTLVKSLRI